MAQRLILLDRWEADFDLQSAQNLEAKRLNHGFWWGLLSLLEGNPPKKKNTAVDRGSAWVKQPGIGWLMETRWLSSHSP